MTKKKSSGTREPVQTFTANIPVSLNIAYDKALVRERERTGERVTRTAFFIKILTEYLDKEK